MSRRTGKAAPEARLDADYFTILSIASSLFSKERSYFQSLHQLSTAFSLFFSAISLYTLLQVYIIIEREVL